VIPSYARASPTYTCIGHQFSSRPGKLVIGIDLATTRCCVDTVFLEDGVDYKSSFLPTRLFNEWTSNCDVSTKAPGPIVAIWYDSAGNLHTGNELELQMRRSRPMELDLNRVFRQWKMLFHEHQNDPFILELQKDLTQKLEALGKDKEILLKDWVRWIYIQLLVPQENGLYALRGSEGFLKAQDIRVVVTVPPGRSSARHDTVMKAFCQGPISWKQVSLVAEPEAMFRSWVEGVKEGTDFKVSDSAEVVVLIEFLLIPFKGRRTISHC
jgi:hypothetical protein